jgi:predicted dehydrogenase
MSAVKCAVVGVGMMGAKHAEILASSMAAELVVCCDIDLEAAVRVPPGCPFTTDMEEALDWPELDAVFIATPQQHHLLAVESAMKRNLSIFLEKPIADTLKAADSIVDMSRRYASTLVVGHMYRFDPRFRAVALAAQGGQLGNLVHVSVRLFTPDFEGQALARRTTLANENAIHAIDTLHWIAGDVERVYGEASSTGVVGQGLPDSIVATVRFRSGAVGSLQVDWALPSGSGVQSVDDVFVVGSGGVCWIDGRDSGVAVLRNNHPANFPSPLWYEGPGGRPSGLYQLEDDYFLAAIGSRAPWPISLEEARAAVAVGTAIDMSIAQRRPVELSELAR